MTQYKRKKCNVGNLGLEAVAPGLTLVDALITITSIFVSSLLLFFASQALQRLQYFCNSLLLILLSLPKGHSRSLQFSFSCAVSIAHSIHALHLISHCISKILSSQFKELPFHSPCHLLAISFSPMLPTSLCHVSPHVSVKYSNASRIQHNRATNKIRIWDYLETVPTKYGQCGALILLHWQCFLVLELQQMSKYKGISSVMLDIRKTMPTQQGWVMGLHTCYQPERPACQQGNFD